LNQVQPVQSVNLCRQYRQAVPDLSYHFLCPFTATTRKKGQHAGRHFDTALKADTQRF
jgi:hypothetical protein